VKENGQCRIRYNKELYEAYKELDLVTFIQLKRFQWAGHVQQLPLDRIPKKKTSVPFSPAIDQSENPERDGKMRLSKMLPAYFGVATGS
jgi:hypothetical protein